MFPLRVPRRNSSQRFLRFDFIIAVYQYLFLKIFSWDLFIKKRNNVQYVNTVLKYNL